MEAVVFLVVWLGCAAITSYIWKSKGRSAPTGFVLGFLLGLLGLIISLFLRDLNEPAEASFPQRQVYRECPSCKESMRRDASVCPHCRRESTPWLWDGRHWTVEGAEGRFYLDEIRNEWVRDDAVPAAANGAADQTDGAANARVADGARPLPVLQWASQESDAEQASPAPSGGALS